MYVCPDVCGRRPFPLLVLMVLSRPSASQLSGVCASVRVYVLHPLFLASIVIVTLPIFTTRALVLTPALHT